MTWSAQTAHEINETLNASNKKRAQESFAEIIAAGSHEMKSITRLLSGDPQARLDTAFAWADTELGRPFWLHENETLSIKGLSPAAVLYLYDCMREAQKILLDKTPKF